MQRLPDVLGPDVLPLAELHAMRLLGETCPVGQCFRPLDVPDSAAVRASSVAALATGRLIADRLTAAWVWGGVTEPPGRAQLCVDITARSSAEADHRATLREVRIDPGDVVSIAGARVMSPMRTAVDLARDPAIDDDTVIAALVGLARAGAIELAECIDRNARHRTQNRSLLGARRLGAATAASAVVDAVDVVDGVDAPDGVENAVQMGRVAHLEHEPAERQSVA